MLGLVIRNRIISAILVPAFLAATIGFPIPEWPAKSGKDFPCKDHACGCFNAEMCRTQCCCFKPAAEKSCCTKSEDDRKAEVGCDEGEASANRLAGTVIAPLTCKGATSHWIAVSFSFGLRSIEVIPTPSPGKECKAPVGDRVPPDATLLPDVPPPRA